MIWHVVVGEKVVDDGDEQRVEEEVHSFDGGDVMVEPSGALVVTDGHRMVAAYAPSRWWEVQRAD